MDNKDLEYYQKITNSIKILAIDMINEANSGHPGIVLGAAPILTVLWANFINVNPKNTSWFNRDRFVLSSGHASALLYSILYHSGYDISIEDLKAFRQLNSITPGHPEYGITPGIEATTGPLGQGLSIGVGMALAEKKMSHMYNRPDFNIVDHYTYVLCGDGDLMEGISTESASLAGTHNLNKLIVLYDSNNINLDGRTEECFTEDIQNKFKSLNWNTIFVEKGNDFHEINEALLKAKQSSKPTLIEFKTIIGKDSSYEGTNLSHGKPLSDENVSLLRAKLSWTYNKFEVPEKIKKIFEFLVSKRGIDKNKIWDVKLKTYRSKYPELFSKLKNSVNKTIPLIKWPAYEEGFMQATRDSSYDCIQLIYKNIPYILSGSADLSSSTMSNIKDSTLFNCKNLDGNNIQYGVREFAMAGIANGIALHTGFIPLVSTFLVFSDYLKAALRLSALMNQQVVFILSHDSIAIGEDGPTHQPVEQLSTLRATPNLYVFRPADARETAASWHSILKIQNAPSALILSRQKLPVTEFSNSFKALKGAYIYYKEKTSLKVLLISSGSEVHLCLEAAKKLEEQRIGVRVISVPCLELFELQSEEYKNEIFPDNSILRVFVEMANGQSWYKYSDRKDIFFEINKFGKSAKMVDIMKEYGFAVDNIVKTVHKKLQNIY